MKERESERKRGRGRERKREGEGERERERERERGGGRRDGVEREREKSVSQTTHLLRHSLPDRLDKHRFSAVYQWGDRDRHILHYCNNKHFGKNHQSYRVLCDRER